jgi:hypothetical protein
MTSLGQSGKEAHHQLESLLIRSLGIGPEGEILLHRHTGEEVSLGRDEADAETDDSLGWKSGDVLSLESD